MLKTHHARTFCDKSGNTDRPILGVGCGIYTYNANVLLVFDWFPVLFVLSKDQSNRGLLFAIRNHYGPQTILLRESYSLPNKYPIYLEKVCKNILFRPPFKNNISVDIQIRTWYDPYFLVIEKCRQEGSRGNLSDNHSSNIFTFGVHNRKGSSDHIYEKIGVKFRIVSGVFF